MFPGVHGTTPGKIVTIVVLLVGLGSSEVSRFESLEIYVKVMFLSHTSCLNIRGMSVYIPRLSRLSPDAQRRVPGIISCLRRGQPASRKATQQMERVAFVKWTTLSPWQK